MTNKILAGIIKDYGPLKTWDRYHACLIIDIIDQGLRERNLPKSIVGQFEEAKLEIAKAVGDFVTH